MAEETLDAAVRTHGLSAQPCKTVGLMLEGAKGWTPTLYIRLVQDYGLENEVGENARSRRAGVPSIGNITAKREFSGTAR